MPVHLNNLTSLEVRSSYNRRYLYPACPQTAYHDMCRTATTDPAQHQFREHLLNIITATAAGAAVPKVAPTPEEKRAPIWAQNLARATRARH